EVVVFAAALEWINHQYLEREEYIVKIFRCIRFSEMTMEEVIACFHPSILPGVVEMAEIKTMLLNATCLTSAFESEMAKFEKEIGEQTSRFEYPKSEVKNYRYFLKRKHEKRKAFPEDLE
ncbi:hypothetical protein JTE90_005789, partial [Oedothorax gibbosus]